MRNQEIVRRKRDPSRALTTNWRPASQEEDPAGSSV
jgi:hypothetical protein